MRQLQALENSQFFFDSRVPGAHRPVDITDVIDMIECGLIRRYGYFIRGDLETIRAILQYERLCNKRSQKSQTKEPKDAQQCKMYGVPLPLQVEGKPGRPKVYFDSCDPLRSSKRNRKWRRRQRWLKRID